MNNTNIHDQCSSITEKNDRRHS